MRCWSLIFAASTLRRLNANTATRSTRETTAEMIAAIRSSKGTIARAGMTISTAVGRMTAGGSTTGAALMIGGASMIAASQTIVAATTIWPQETRGSKTTGVMGRDGAEAGP